MMSLRQRSGSPTGLRIALAIATPVITGGAAALPGDAAALAEPPLPPLPPFPALRHRPSQPKCSVVCIQL